MSIQTPPDRIAIHSVLSNRLFFYIIWFILFFLLLSKITPNSVSIFFSISAILVYTHIFYGGYFLFKKENQIDFIVSFLAALIYAGLIFFVMQINQPFFWFLSLQLIFLLAIWLHLYYKSKVSQIYLKEFCNYKIYVEITGIILNFLGMVFYSLFPVYKAVWGALVLISIVKFNIVIFKKKRLYDIGYQVPDIPKIPLVSIVIIAYNEEEYIGRLLESVKAQGYPRYEIIVVDDHSTDKTAEIVKSYALSLPVRIVQKDIRGASRSRNYGATFAQGEVVIFLDADVVLPAEFIAKNLQAFNKQRLSVAGVDFVPITENNLDKWITGFYRWWLKTVQYFNPRGIGFCLFVCKELHKKVLFDEGVVMSEDFDYIKRATRYGKFRIITTVPLKVSWRRFHKENRFLLVTKYLFFEWYRQNIGEIRKKILPYEFGKS